MSTEGELIDRVQLGKLVEKLRSEAGGGRRLSKLIGETEDAIQDAVADYNRPVRRFARAMGYEPVMMYRRISK